MKKVFTKIAGLSVGLAMAIGVGVAVGSRSAKVVKAADPAIETFSHTAIAGMATSAAESTSGTYSVFTITVDGIASSGFNASESVRVYKGASITISVSSGNITSATLTCTANGTAKYGPGCLTGSGYTAGTKKDGTWTGEASSFTLVAESNQARISDFSITYVAGGEVTTYTISYNANGGSGEMEDTVSANPAVAACGFTAPEGKVFDRWNTQANGGGTDYAVGATPGADLDLYAIWEEAPLGGTINFGNATGSTQINDVEITGEDSYGLEWTVTTVANEKSFTQQSSYSQIGSSSKPATSITFTATLASSMKVVAFSAKFGGFNSTAGDIALKVDDTTVGTGSLSAASDVVVEATDVDQIGTTLAVTVTNIAKGVKVYYISYELENGGDPSKDTLVVKLNDSLVSPQTVNYTPVSGWLFYANDKDGNDINSDWTSSDESIFTVSKNGNNVAVVEPHDIGTATLTASAEGYNSGSFVLTIVPGTVEEIVVTGSMSKTSYYVGESWSHDGLVATATYDTMYEKDVSEEAAWSYSPASPALNVTSVVATATLGTVSGNSSAQSVTVTRANPLKALYSKNNGDSITAVGYYVGFSAADGAYIMDGEYGFLLGDKNLDPSEWVEGETVLRGTGTLYKTSSNQYKFSYTNLSVEVVTDEAVIAEISEPVVYSSTGNETTPDYQNRVTTVSGAVASVDQGSLTADPGTSDIKMTFTVGTNNVVVFYKKGVQDSTTMTNLKAALDSNPKTEITVKGFTSWYNGFQVQMNGIVEEKEDYTAEDFAQDLINRTDAVCVNYVDGESSYSEFKAELTTIWNDLASNDKYPSLPGAQKTILAEAARDEEGNVVEQAMARYDFLTGKYELSNFINGRTPIVPAGRIDFSSDISQNSSMIIIVSIAATSALAFTMLLVFKKKKQK